MLKKLIPTLIICFNLILCFGQVSKYHRASINLENKNPLLLLKAGIALDHGKMAIGRYFESDFSDQEINTIRQIGFDVKIVIKDVESYYASQERPSEIIQINESTRTNNCKSSLFDYKTPNNYFEGSMGGYFQYDEMLVILDWMKTNYPNIISKIDTIKGYKTYDGNVIHYLKVSDNPDQKEDEPEVLYTALHHAREPNSLSQMIFYLWYLLENYNTNPEIKYLVDNTEMYFIPCVNPDGYKFNEKNNPQGGGLWRKNTRKDDTGKVQGVDLNRNYGYEWGYDNTGSSILPSDATYRGPSAFSEPETSAIREFCVSHNFKIALNYHTFGNYVIHPWGYSDLPTDEDAIFKGMGEVMNENATFKLGTATETVQYIVNGTSDDYMYGDEIEKNKTYSMTPEIGPSFWPAKKDIDFLNKTCVKMNLALPRLVNSYLEHKVVFALNDYKLIDTINVNITKASFKKEEVGITLSLDPYFGNNTMTYSLNLNQGESQLVKLPYSIIEKNLKTGENIIKAFVKKDYGSFQSLDSFTFVIYQGTKEYILKDDASDDANWLSNFWGTSSTPGYFTSGPSSLTDTPGAAYLRNQTNTIKLRKAMDFTNAVSPVLSFNARWNIENNFDYAAVYAYEPGKDTVWLCGKYSNVGTIDQKPGYPIYDGDQNEFIHESISLSEFEGRKNIYLNFEMVSDNFLEQDGIYIDDIEVFSYRERVSTDASDIEGNNALVFYPNPSNGLFSIRMQAQEADLIIYNNLGQKVWESHILKGDKIDLSDLGIGVYSAKLVYDQIIHTSNIFIAK
jgi:carboxypeptidase T